MKPRTVDDVIAQLPRPQVAKLQQPDYIGTRSSGAMLSVESMRLHMTDEGYQLQEGLSHADYTLFGHGYRALGGCTDVPSILTAYRASGPGVVLVQDQREWDGLTADRNRDPTMRFTNVKELGARPDIFTGTVLKDAHNQPLYHRQSADVMQAHFWVVYYHPRIITHVAPYVRPQHLIRHYHTVDATAVPPYSPHGRMHSLLSGAISGAYPLRTLLIYNLNKLPGTDSHPHPGYHRRGPATPEYLKLLSRYKVAICTSSMYGYSLRRIIEATACGCAVITDLPSDDVLPHIDGNLTRISTSSMSGGLAAVAEVAGMVQYLAANYDPERQAHYARLAREWYDWRASGVRLADNIESLRKGYRHADESKLPEDR